MKLLAIETSAQACSLALMVEEKMFCSHEIAPREQAQIILPRVQALLDLSNIAITELDYIAFGKGPGSFTGVRLATSIAQGLALGLNCAVIPVSSLAALAQAIHEQTKHNHIVVAIDARMDEIYFGEFTFVDGRIKSASEALLKPEAFPRIHGDFIAVGNGWQIYANRLTKLNPLQVYNDELPDALFIAKLAIQAESIAPHLALPTYLRNDVALKTREQQALKKNDSDET